MTAEDWRNGMLSRMEDIEGKLQQLDNRIREMEIAQAKDSAIREANTEEIKKLNSNLTWAIRLILGAIILAAGGMLLAPIGG